MLNRFFIVALTTTLIASGVSAQQTRDRQIRCGPYATPGVSFDGRATCTPVSSAVRQQIILQRKQAYAQEQRSRELATQQRQRNAEISKTLSERNVTVLEREKAIARDQRQPEEMLKQNIVRRYWPKY